MNKRPNVRTPEQELLAAADALLLAKDNQMETPVEWRRLRRAVRALRKHAALEAPARPR